MPFESLLSSWMLLIHEQKGRNKSNYQASSLRSVFTFSQLHFWSKLALSEVVLHETVGQDSKICCQRVHIHHSFLPLIASFFWGGGGERAYTFPVGPYGSPDN